MNGDTQNLIANKHLQNLTTKKRNKVEKQNFKTENFFDSLELSLNNNNNNEAELILTNSEKFMLKIKKLNNSSCYFNKLPSNDLDFKYLTELNLSENFLENLPEEIMYLKNLIWLNISKNNLSCLPRTLILINQLIYLNISKNRFVEVPEVIYCGLRNIRILDMSCNKISKFKDPPACLSKIMELKLCENSLDTFPAWIFQSICQLQVLDLSNNQFNPRLKPVINYYNAGVFKTLKILKIENCNYNYERLEYLSHFKNLEILHIGKKNSGIYNKDLNYLGNLQMSFFTNFKKIKALYLENVSISILPTDIDCLKNVEILSLASNKLSWLPENICSFRCLKFLNLSFNQLFYLPNDIGKIESLTQIHLENNNLYKLPNSFIKLNNLEFLDLYNNELEEIEINILKLKKLKGIDLEVNYLDFKNIMVKEIEKQYICLKLNFRKSFNCLNGREDFQKSKSPNQNEYILDFSTIDSKSSTSFFECDLCSDAENIDFHAATEYEPNISNEWGELNTFEVEEDELFDPNREFLINSKPESTLDTNFSNYCPANSHALPVFNKCLRNDEVVEGQFDLD